MKDVKCMIEINKDEAKYLREHGVWRGITRLMKQDSSRKHYFCAEEAFILDLLEQYRSSLNVVEVYGDVKS